MHETFTQSHIHPSVNYPLPILELPNQIFTEHFKNSQNADSLHHMKCLRGENETGKTAGGKDFQSMKHAKIGEMS